MSLVSLVILSYDRYSTLTVYNKQGPGYRKPLLAVAGSWIYAFIWTVPPLLGWSSYGLEGAGTSCSVSWTEHSTQSQSYIICLLIFCLGLPVLVMVYSYGKLLYTVKQVRSISSEEIYMYTSCILVGCNNSPEIDSEIVSCLMISSNLKQHRV